MSLKIRMVIFFLLVGLIPLAGIGVISFTMAQQNIRDEVYAKIDMFANLNDAQVENYFIERVHDGRVMAATRDVYQSLNVLQATRKQAPAANEEEPAIGSDQAWQDRVVILNNLLPLAAEEYNFEQIFLTDPQGLVVYDSLRYERAGT